MSALFHVMLCRVMLCYFMLWMEVHDSAKARLLNQYKAAGGSRREMRPAVGGWAPGAHSRCLGSVVGSSGSSQGSLGVGSSRDFLGGSWAILGGRSWEASWGLSGQSMGVISELLGQS